MFCGCGRFRFIVRVIYREGVALVRILFCFTFKLGQNWSFS